MQARPTAPELLDAVRHHLTAELLPSMEGARLRFQTLVAANVLEIVARELALTEAHTLAEWKRLAGLLAETGPPPEAMAGRQAAITDFNRRLCRQIESGAFDEAGAWEAVLDHCRATAREKVAVTNPRFLRRMETATR